MSRKIVMAFLSFAAILVIAFQAYDRSALKKECDELKARELMLRKEADAEKQIWSKMYRDCVEEKDGLISRLKAVSTAQSGGSSK